MERPIERSQLKRNFLNEIIMRLDFQGVLQAEMEKVILKAKPFLKEKSFNRYRENIRRFGNTSAKYKKAFMDLPDIPDKDQGALPVAANFREGFLRRSATSDTRMTF